jgi:hypothetical protein
MAESQEALFKNLQELSKEFDQQVKKLGVKDLVQVHQGHIEQAAKTQTSADNKKRKAELEKIQEEVKKVIKRYEARIKSGAQMDNKDLQAIKDMNAKLREQTEKLAKELGEGKQQTQAPSPAPSPTADTKTDQPASTATTTPNTAKPEEPKKANTGMMIGIGVVVLAVVVGVLFVVMQPPPPPPPKTWIPTKTEPKPEEKKWFAPTKEPEPESSMMLPIILVVLCAAGGAGFFLMQKPKGPDGKPITPGLGLERDEDASIKGSKRVAGKKKSYAGQDDDTSASEE